MTKCAQLQYTACALHAVRDHYVFGSSASEFQRSMAVWGTAVLLFTWLGWFYAPPASAMARVGHEIDRLQRELSASRAKMRLNDCLLYTSPSPRDS